MDTPLTTDEFLGALPVVRVGDSDVAPMTPLPIVITPLPGLRPGWWNYWPVCKGCKLRPVLSSRKGYGRLCERCTPPRRGPR